MDALELQISEDSCHAQNTFQAIVALWISGTGTDAGGFSEFRPILPLACSVSGSVREKPYGSRVQDRF